MSSRERGNGLELRVRHLKERLGFLVHPARQAALRLGSGRVITHSHDIFRVGDMLCAKWPEPAELIQVTTVAHRADHRRKIERELSRAVQGAGGHLRVELWSWGRWEARGYGFNVEEYSGGELWLQRPFVPSKEAP